MIDISLQKFGVYIVDTLGSEQAIELVKFIESNSDKFEDESQRGIGFNTKARGTTLGRLYQAGVTEAQEWDQLLFNNYVNAIQKLNETLPFPVVVDSDAGYNLRKFDTGKDTDQHIDNLDFDGNTVRCLTAVTFLNSHHHIGGELVFPIQGLKVKPEPGQTVFFPPYWTHPHYAKAVEKGARYTVNTWFRQVPFS